MKRPIYLDYNSTTPLDSRCLEAMLPFLTEDFGNAANEIHSMGWTAKNAINKATSQVAHLLNCKPHEIIWNSGATEGNNAVLKFLSEYDLRGKTRPHFITSAIEHPSVLQTCLDLQAKNKIDLSIISVNQQGFIDLEQLKSAINPQTVLCSILWINNEIGTVQNLQAIADICAQKNIYLHTDATQAVGKIHIDLTKIQIHFLTTSAHKFYGPKGTGFLYIRSVAPHAPTPKLMSGGPHQNGFRPGTMNTASIVATGVACEIIRTEMNRENDIYKNLIQGFLNELKSAFPHLIVNGPQVGSDQRSPMNLNITFPDRPIDLYLSKLTGIAFSQGSACHSGETSMSQTLMAIGLTEKQATSTIRLSVGRLTTAADLKQAADLIIRALASN